MDKVAETPNEDVCVSFGIHYRLHWSSRSLNTILLLNLWNSKHRDLWAQYHRYVACGSYIPTRNIILDLLWIPVLVQVKTREGTAFIWSHPVHWPISILRTLPLIPNSTRFPLSSYCTCLTGRVSCWPSHWTGASWVTLLCAVELKAEAKQWRTPC